MTRCARRRPPPPGIDWETDAAFSAVEERVSALERAHGIPAAHGGKAAHAARLRSSGLFRHVREMAVHGQDTGDAQRLVSLARSVLASIPALLASGASEDDLGLTALREVAGRRLAGPRRWWWTYHLYLAAR